MEKERKGGKRKGKGIRERGRESERKQKKGLILSRFSPTASILNPNETRNIKP